MDQRLLQGSHKAHPLQSVHAQALGSCQPLRPSVFWLSGMKGFHAGTYRDHRDVFDFLLKLVVVVAIVVLIQMEQSRLSGLQAMPLICRCGCKA